MKMGTLIKNARLKRGLSQADVELKTDMGRLGQMISQVESGRLLLPDRRIREVAKILGLRQSDLVDAKVADIKDRILRNIKQQTREEKNGS